jgi:hypothetical protein
MLQAGVSIVYLKQNAGKPVKKHALVTLMYGTANK